MSFKKPYNKIRKVCALNNIILSVPTTLKLKTWMVSDSLLSSVPWCLILSEVVNRHCTHYTPPNNGAWVWYTSCQLFKLELFVILKRDAPPSYHKVMSSIIFWMLKKEFAFYSTIHYQNGASLVQCIHSWTVKLNGNRFCVMEINFFEIVCVYHISELLLLLLCVTFLRRNTLSANIQFYFNVME